MSAFVADIIIWILLAAGTVFAGVSIMGLLIFPDTKSRMFTAFRGTAIAVGLVCLAVLTYGFALFSESGDPVYAGLIIRTFFLLLVLGAGLWGMYGILCNRTGWRPGTAEQDVPEKKTEEAE